MSAPARSRPDGRPALWVSTTYFGEGYPYSVVNNLAEVLFTSLGASLGAIGLTSLLHLPWNLKFLWGPFVDQYETKRRWLLAVEVGLTVAMLALAVVAGSRRLVWAVSAAFVLLALLAATHDIAIDGFYLEVLDEQGQSRFVGLRAFAYKLANLLVRGPALVLIGYVGWRVGLFALAALMGLLTLVHLWILPRTEQPGRPLGELGSRAWSPRTALVGATLVALIVVEARLGLLRPAWQGCKAAVAKLPLFGTLSVGGFIAITLLLVLLMLLALRGWIVRRFAGDSHYAAAFVDFLAQPEVGRVLAFVVLFRTGESFLMKMKVPFLQRELGLSLAQYGFANGTVGVAASFSATLLGGWLISRHGLRRWIWPFVLAQNVLNLLYVALAKAGPVGLSAITGVIALENFGEGLGTAVFMVYLMRCCDPRHKASHMAILTALMSVSFTVAGVASGFLADWLGYAHYFAFCFVATIPGMLLVFVVPFLDGRPTTA